MNLKAEEARNKKKMPKQVPCPEAESKKPKELSFVAEAASESEKPKELSLAEAASKIDPSHLAAYLANSPKWYPGSELLKLVDYFGEALSGVSSVQFPWPEMDKLIDVINHPLCHLPRPVYRTAAAWISNVVPPKIAGSVILWSFDFIRALLAGKRTPPKSHVSVFIALSMVLRNNRSGFVMILPILRMGPYKAEDKLPLTVWMMAQVSQVDLSLALRSWANNLLPLVKHCSNPQSRDLILQLVEYIILSYPNARTIHVNNSVQEGNALTDFASFIADLAAAYIPCFIQQSKGRFEAVYPLLKEVALADTPGKEAMKQLTLEIFTFSLKLAGQGNPVLAKEATSIAIWCLTKNVDCCNHWDNVYNENPKASVALLRKLVRKWKDHSHKLSSSWRVTRTLDRTMKSFMLKNKKHITEGGANGFLYNEVDKHSEEISWRLSRASGFLKGIAISAVLLVAAVAAALYSKLVGSFDPH